MLAIVLFASTPPVLPATAMVGAADAVRIALASDVARREYIEPAIAWLPSVGGEKWFANYLATFGAPGTPCVFKADSGQLKGVALGHYYLRHPVQGDRLVAEPDCFIALGGLYGIKDRFTTTMVAHMALANWDAFLVTGGEKYKEAFIRQAKELLSSHRDGRWEWKVDIPSRGLRAPWISGMTQALGVSVLLRAYQLTGDSDFLVGAKQSFVWMRVPVSRGGVVMPAETGVWFEEYPNTASPSHVLNGHIWALFGVWDYFRVTRDPGARALFNQGVRALKLWIHRYDVGYWVVYDQLNQVDMINGFYLSFIVEQLKVLGNITGDSFFNDYATKWADYQSRHTLFGWMAVEEYLKDMRSAGAPGALKK